MRYMRRYIWWFIPFNIHNNQFKYYIDLLGSEYNIVKDHTLPPMSGRTHSDATKIIMSDAKKPVG